MWINRTSWYKVTLVLPEITAARLAAKRKIRIGTGGAVMMHYSPLKLAEVFKTLSAFSRKN